MGLYQDQYFFFSEHLVYRGLTVFFFFQKCKDRHSNTQSILRAKERSETALLLQRVQEQKNKKVGKFKPVIFFSWKFYGGSVF